MNEEIKQLLRELFSRLNSSNTTDSNSSSSSTSGSSGGWMSDAEESYFDMEAVKQILGILQTSYIAEVYDIKNLIDGEDLQAIEEIESFLNNSGKVEIKNQLVSHRLDLGIDVDSKTKEVFWELADEYFEETPELLMEGFSEALEELKQIRTRKEEVMAHLLDTTDIENVSHILDDSDIESFDEHMARMAKAMENILDLANIESCRDDIANIKKYLKENKDNFSKEMLPELKAMRNKFAENWESIAKNLEARNPKECLGLQEMVKLILDKLDAKYSAIFLEMVGEVLEVLVPDYMQELRNIETCVSGDFSPAVLASFFEHMKNPSMLEIKDKLVRHELNLAPTEEQGAQVCRIWDSYGFNVGKDIDQRKENFWRLADMVFKQKPMLLMEADKKKLKANYETAARMCQHRIDMADMFLKKNTQNTSNKLLQELEAHRIHLVEWEVVAQELESRTGNEKLCGRVVYCKHVLQKKVYTIKIYEAIRAAEQFLERNKDNFSKELLLELKDLSGDLDKCKPIAERLELHGSENSSGLCDEITRVQRELSAKRKLCTTKNKRERGNAVNIDALANNNLIERESRKLRRTEETEKPELNSNNADVVFSRNALQAG